MERFHIGEVVRDIERGTKKLWQWANSGKQNSKQNYTLMFYGFGEIAEEALFQTLARTDLHRPLKRVYLASHDLKRSDWLLKKYQLEWESREGRVVSPEVHIQPVKVSKAREHIGDVDLCFVTANKAPREVLDRTKILKYNLDLVPDLVGLVNESKSTQFEIVTSLGEVLASAVHQKSRGDPRQMWAHSHVDKLRLDARIIRDFKEQGIVISRTEGYCIGYHDNPWPVLNGLRVEVDRDMVAVDAPTTKTQHEITDFVRRYGWKQAELVQLAQLDRAPTSKETGKAISEVVAAFVNGNRFVNASMYDEKYGLYLEAPTSFQHGAKPNKPLLDRMSVADATELHKRQSELERLLHRFGIQNMKTVVDIPFETLDPGEVRRTQYREITKQKKAITPIPPAPTFPASLRSFDSRQPKRYGALHQYGIKEIVLAGVLAGGVLGGSFAVYAGAFTGVKDSVVSSWNNLWKSRVEKAWEKHDVWFLERVFQRQKMVYIDDVGLMLEKTHSVHYSPDGRHGFVDSMDYFFKHYLLVFDVPTSKKNPVDFSVPLKPRLVLKARKIGEEQWVDNNTISCWYEEEMFDEKKYIMFDINHDNQKINTRDNTPDTSSRNSSF